MTVSKGALFRNLVKEHKPLQVLGAINAYSAMLAQSAGAKAIYLSGAGVANASFGLPDLGITSLTEVVEDARRITDASPLPLLVDIDTGWGNEFNITRTIQQMERAGVAAVHIEDQISAKRCGHRPNKTIVSLSEMGDRIKAAVDARQDPNFVIMARTDAYAVEGLNAALERAAMCVELGADMIFPEAMKTLDEYQAFTSAIDVPMLANSTEFGLTPLFTAEEFASVGMALVLYPLSASRSMFKAALTTYEAIIKTGSQQSVVASMQTREELYQQLGYYAYEQKLDEYNRRSK